MITHFPEHTFLCADKVALFQPNQEFSFGRIEEVMTEEALSDTFGVAIKIPEILDINGEPFKTCVPLITRKSRS